MKTTKPFFSIIIPTYNRKKILSRSINSVLSQTFFDFELIIVDNGSTDNTKEWLSNNIKDERLKYFYQDGTGSPASPRNKGVQLSKGEWVCFLDSDDIWLKDKLQEVFNKIQDNKNLDVICHNERLYFESQDRYGKVLRYGPNSHSLYKDMLIYGNRLSTSATSIKLSFLKDSKINFNESNHLSMVEDYDLWLNLARNGAKFNFLKKILGYYVVGSSNMISNSELFCKNLKNLLKLHAFELQTFANANILWKKLRVRHEICKIRYIKLGINNKTFSFLELFIKYPIAFMSLFVGYLNRNIVLHYIDIFKK